MQTFSSNQSSMAVVVSPPISPLCSLCRRNCLHNLRISRRIFHSYRLALFKTAIYKRRSDFSGHCFSRVSCRSQSVSRGPVAVNRGSSDLRLLENNNGHSINTPLVEIPVTCYQILGVPDKSEKDEIVKSVKHLKNAEIEEGYTANTIVSRQNLLMDVRDKLLFEPDYAGNIKEKVPPKSSLHIPWAWLPACLCLLQEVGEEKLALDIARKAVQHPDAKPFIHDLLLSMALAECAVAKLSFEKNRISQGFEALARAQCLLKRESSLEKMTLLSQIEESLEELAPACTLELLGMPHTPENAERRVGAIAALRELLRQGLDVETSCQVQDWSCFLIQALNRLTAQEIVELLAWETLANIRKNKKSLESQNQRVVVDLNCFCMIMVAHLAHGFSSKQTHVINKAKIICECLMASDGIDLKFEEAFCSFLLGQGEESMAAEKLRLIESNSNSTSQTLISGKDVRDVPSSKKLLESWLKDSALSLFLDTKNCSPSLDSFFRGEKKACEDKHRKRAPQASSSVSHRSPTPALPPDWRTFEDHVSTSRSLGPAVKQLTPSTLQVPLIPNAVGESNASYPAVHLKRNIGAPYNRVWETWLDPNNAFLYLSYTAALTCILLATFKLVGVRSWWMGSADPRINTSSLSGVSDSCLGSWGSAWHRGNIIASRLKKLLSTKKALVRTGLKTSDLQEVCHASSLPSSMTTYKRPMDMEEAETLVKEWQAIKAEALGPNHDIHSLANVLDESMLAQWQDLAEAAKSRCCFWRFVLLQLSVIRADIFSDGTGNEIAEIQAVLEEAAELVDASPPKNPNYYSSYTIRYVLKRQDNGSWRFCGSEIQNQE